MDNIVVTLDTARKLKDAGYPQKAIFWHMKGEFPGVSFRPSMTLDKNVGAISTGTDPICAAPTAQELADAIGPASLHIIETSRGWSVYGVLGASGCKASTIAEALAALWLKLHEALSSGDGLEGQQG